MGRVPARPSDRLKVLGELRGILDALATGGIVPSQGYERLRRQLLADAELRPYLPDWLGDTRTTDEAKALLTGSRHPSEYVGLSLERALGFLEEAEFSPRREGSRGSTAMRCPHCTIAMSPVRERFGGQMFYKDTEGADARVEAVACPQCSGVFLVHTYFETSHRGPAGPHTSRENVPGPPGDVGFSLVRASSRASRTREPREHRSVATSTGVRFHGMRLLRAAP